VATPEFLAECARALLREPSNVPAGVHTTASAFAGTQLLVDLQVSASIS
jgi:hypothetical protein